MKKKESNSQNRLELSQTLSLVYDTQLFKNKNEEETIWSFSSVFNQRIQSFCPVASFSNIYMDIKTNGVNYELELKKIHILLIFIKNFILRCPTQSLLQQFIKKIKKFMFII
jgi:hypothetical protein